MRLKVLAVMAPLLFTIDPAASQNALQLEGVHNFRDIGGYTTPGGGLVRRGVLYRSADLGDMTVADRGKLRSLGIRYEIDLRSPAEISKRPSNWGNDEPQVSAPFDYDPLSLLNSRKTEMEVYADIALGQARNIGAVFRQLANADRPVLLHCAAGADRTGIVIAMLMRLLGATQEQVADEYLRSNDYWTSEGGREDLRRRTGMSEEAVEAWPGLKRHLLDDMFRAVDARYGSFDGYVRGGLRLSPREVQVLRVKFLAPLKSAQ